MSESTKAIDKREIDKEAAKEAAKEVDKKISKAASEMSPKKSILEDIERLRGFACLIVFIHHIAFICPLKFIYNLVPYRFMSGESGVYLFFAISGFVVTLSLREKIDQLAGSCFLERIKSAKSLICSFYKRRFFRIFPVMFLGVLMTGVFLLLSEPDSKWIISWTRSIPELLSGVFQYSEELFQYAGDNLHNGGMGPMWTLAVESQFYMLWPLLLILCSSNNARAIMSFLGGCLFLFAIQPTIAGFIGIKYYALYNDLPALMLGAFLAFIYDENIGKNVGKRSAQIITACLAIGLWYYPNAIERTYFCRMPVSIGSVLLLMYCAYVKDSFNFPILGRIFKFLGSRSYSFYVIQLPLANWVVYYTNSIYFPKESLSNYDFYLYQLLIYMVVVSLGTELTYRCLEKPLRKLGRK